MGKSGSKRETLSHKYKVQRKVKEHNRKMKRLARANPHLLRRAKKQDPGIPNLWPNKEAMLRAAQVEVSETEAARLAAKASKKERIAKAKAAKEQADNEVANEYRNLNTPEGKRKWYYRELTKVVETADVILEVLDARDPLGCRAADIERRILSAQTKDGAPSKKLVLVLNKIDMVPPEVAAEWVRYLRREHPTIAFKSSTSTAKGHLNSLDVKASKASSKALETKASVGGQALIQLLKNYARSLDVKKGLTVGVIGYPNVGKSSIINSLKMSRAVQVSAAAGCTKTLQQVRLDSNIMLVDSPGVLFAADDEGVASSADALDDEETRARTQSLLLRNVLRVDQIEDPLVAVQGILARCTREQLMSLYHVAEFTSDREFLYFVAQRLGKLGKGGVPNLDEAARAVLKDWNSGKIPFFTVPPAVDDVTESTVVNGFSEAFDIAGLLDSANERTVAVVRDSGMSAGAGAMDDDEEDGDDDYDDDDDMNDDEAAAAASLQSMMRAVKPVAVRGQVSASALIVEESDDDGDEDESALSTAVAAARAGMADSDGEEEEDILAKIAPTAFARVGKGAAKAEKAFSVTREAKPVTQAMSRAAGLVSARSGRSKQYKVLHDESYDDANTGLGAVKNAKAAAKKAKKDQRRAATSGAGAGMGDDYDFETDY
jgi:nuclear GTP-binding protein